uniref:Uncharacterized protein LOC114342293 n=1 Tax=Diabrotica virgifera virgifera TaxID=50390 RepID=A0A6P7GS60_DIAVI
MQRLFDRLETKLDEATMVKYIRRNLLPKFMQPLALVDISSVAELKVMCRRLEESFDLTEASSSSYRPRNDMESNVSARSSDTRTFRPIRQQINAVTSNSRNPGCWNCGGGHFFVQCTLPLKMFCYGCGLPGVIKPRCNVCSKNEYGRGEV